MTKSSQQTASLTLAAAKAEAKALRAALAAKGQTISHSEALEQVAARHGARDWNTLSAQIRDVLPDTYAIGARVRGHYLGQAFEATVLNAATVSSGWTRLELSLDEPVDVVVFESFSNLRKRVRGTVGPNGRSKEVTSDGRPHLEIDLEIDG